MSVLSAVRSGCTALRTRFFVIWKLYLFGLLAALPFSVGVGFMVDEFFAKTLAASDFARAVDLHLWFELWIAREPSFETMGAILVASVGFWLFLSVYLNAATFASVQNIERGFLAAGARVYGRYLRLVLFGGLPCFALGLGLPFFLFKLANRMSKDWNDDARIFGLKIAVLSFSVLWWCFVNGAYDLMRVRLLSNEKSLRALKEGFWLAIKHPFDLLVLYGSFCGPIALFTFLALLVDVGWSRENGFHIALGFFLQQAVVFARTGAKVALVSAEVTRFASPTS